MNRALLIAALGILCAQPLAAQEKTAQFGSPSGTQILFRSTTDIDILGPTIAAFTNANPEFSVTFEQWGSNDLYDLTRSDCASGQTADAVLSSAVHQMVELVNNACAAPYRSTLTTGLPADRNWRDELWGITREAAVIIYNKDLVPAEEVPHTRFELLDLMRREDPRYSGRIATYDIEASGLGYLFAFSDSIEASTFGALLEGFSRSDAVATCCSAAIIRGVDTGRYLLAYNVLGSYARMQDVDNVGIILPEDYTLFLSRAYMIPRGAENAEGATRLLDFLLSAEGLAEMTRSGLIMERTPEEDGLAESSERAIPIEPVLLVARDLHRQKRFIAQWRATFGAPQYLTP